MSDDQDPIEALKHIRALTESAFQFEDAETLLQYLDMIKTVVDKVWLDRRRTSPELKIPLERARRIRCQTQPPL